MKFNFRKMKRKLHKNKMFKYIKKNIMAIISLIISIIAVVPVVVGIFERPVYTATLNYPGGWKTDEMLFIVNNNKKVLSNHSFIETRAFAILSEGIEGSALDLFSDNLYKPLYALDDAFKVTGNQEGILGYIKMHGAKNPFANYIFWNVYEFGADLIEDVSTHNNFDGDLNYNSIQLVIFTIIWKDTAYKKYSVDNIIDSSNITVLATTTYGSQEIDVEKFLKKYYEDGHSVERRYKTDNFWDNEDFAKDIYYYFVDEISKLHSQKNK